MKRSHVRLSPQKPGPKLNGTAQIRIFTIIARQPSYGSSGKNRRLIRLPRHECHERSMPIYLVTSDSHGGKQKSITEKTTLLHEASGLFNFLRARVRSIE